MSLSLDNPDYFLNREITLLQFHLRVLQQSLMERHPLLERLKFLLIFSNNLDEFFEIRVAGLKRRILADSPSNGIDQTPPQVILSKISQMCRNAVDTQYSILDQLIFPAMAQEQIRFIKRKDWSPGQIDWARRYFRSQILPILSPIALDPSHPFPRIANKTLNFMISLEGIDAFGRQNTLALVPAPRSLPRLIQLPASLCEAKHEYIFLSSIIHEFAGDIFPEMTIHGCYQFRVTRNADLYLADEDIDDLALSLKGELYSRRFGDAVRLEVADNCPCTISDFLLEKFNLSHTDLYQVKGMVNLSRLFPVTELDIPHLRYPKFTPSVPKSISRSESIFFALQQQDILLHHPYESFDIVVEFIKQAAKDPQVLAIKQTLYRVGKNSQILEALELAARLGKEVTAIIELRARFDEEENLLHAKRLQNAGATVCYGVVGYKTHAKLTLVLRRENNCIKRYAHLGTGNYHPKNAKQYTDFSLLTAAQDIGADINIAFQTLTGLSGHLRMRRLILAPFTLGEKLTKYIEREIEYKKAGNYAHIIIKVNALTDKQLIRCFYRASQAGVKIDLIIRGICCLKPQIPGVSDNIRVISIIGRFLEHTRVYYFSNDKDPKVFLSSADLMERSLHRRVETCFPVLDKALAQRIKDEGLGVFLSDNTDAWVMGNDGNYSLVQLNETPRSAQEILLKKLRKDSENHTGNK